MPEARHSPLRYRSARTNAAAPRRTRRIAPAAIPNTHNHPRRAGANRYGLRRATRCASTQIRRRRSGRRGQEGGQFRQVAYGKPCWQAILPDERLGSDLAGANVAHQPLRADGSSGASALVVVPVFRNWRRYRDAARGVAADGRCRRRRAEELGQTGRARPVLLVARHLVEPDKSSPVAQALELRPGERAKNSPSRPHVPDTGTFRHSCGLSGNGPDVYEPPAITNTGRPSARAAGSGGSMVALFSLTAPTFRHSPCLVSSIMITYSSPAGGRTTPARSCQPSRSCASQPAVR